MRSSDPHREANALLTVQLIVYLFNMLGVLSFTPYAGPLF